jgi:imidazole glycerol phosphate synthase glutamine amidotransferase subunit
MLVEVLHYGGGNVGSLLRALERCEIPYTVLKGTIDGSFPSGQYPVILPGVGAFGAIMQGLEERGFLAPLTQAVMDEKMPFLGVCVGLQVLFESSEESPEVAGLGFLKGTVRHFPTDVEGAKVPQIGWNYIHAQQENAPEGFVYYVNSYYAQPSEPSVVLYASEYQGTRFCGAVRQGNITAFQFHPEKSGAFGHELLRHWFENLTVNATP